MVHKKEQFRSYGNCFLEFMPKKIFNWSEKMKQANPLY